MQTEVFYNLTDDLMFKSVFSHKKLAKNLIESVFSYLNEEKEIKKIVVSKDHSFYGEHIHDKVFIGDILAVLNTKELASIEMYTSFGKEEYLKSVAYLSRLFTKQIKRGKSYKRTKPVIGISFMSGNYHGDNSLLVNDYGFIRKIENRNSEDEVIKLYLIRLDLVSKIVYTKNEARLVRWMRLMNASSLEEMKEIGSGDEYMEEAIQYAEEFLKEEGTTFQDKLNFEKSKSFNNGKEIGLKEGEKKGILKTAKNMLKKKYPVQDIAELTNLTIEEIKNIKIDKE